MGPTNRHLSSSDDQETGEASPETLKFRGALSRAAPSYLIGLALARCVADAERLALQFAEANSTCRPPPAHVPLFGATGATIHRSKRGGKSTVIIIMNLVSRWESARQVRSITLARRLCRDDDVQHSSERRMEDQLRPRALTTSTHDTLVPMDVRYIIASAFFKFDRRKTWTQTLTRPGVQGMEGYMIDWRAERNAASLRPS